MFKKFIVIGALALALGGCSSSMEKTYSPEQAVASYYYFGCDRENFEDIVFDTAKWVIESQDDQGYVLGHTDLSTWKMSVSYTGSGALVEPVSDLHKTLRAQDGCTTEEISDETIKTGVADGSIG